ncbi:MAG: type II secretion system F family protein, partial [Desulfoplanes sp.]
MKFLQAGIQNTNAVFIFWGVKLILAFCLAALFLLAKFRFHIILQPMNTAGIALMLALTGIYLPDLWLKNRTNRRRETLSHSFPDALDLMVVCVEAGVGLDSTFNRVAEEFGMSNRELSQEFSLVTLELRAGKSRQDAMNNLARRTGLDEIKDFAGLMIQTLKFGTSISHALRLYADTFRTNRRQKAEEMAAKIPVKLT